MRRVALVGLGLAVLGLPGVVRAQYFGKNKVQYRDQEWRVLETRHFEIHFYAHEAPLVHDAARMAERAYEQIAATLKHELPRRVPLVLYASHSDFQQTHITPSMIDVGTGGVTDLARRRVFLPFNGSYADFQHVLTHELVHAFEIDILFDASQSDPLNPFAFAPPLWVMEGLAEYLSRPKRDTHTDMWLRDAALSGGLLTLEQLEQVYDIRVYRFGQSAFSYFASRYGTERIGDLLRALVATRSLDEAMSSVAGISLRRFSEDWGTAVRRQHLPELARHRMPREFATPVVTREAEDAGMLLVPSISPDGRYLAYVSDAGLTRDLYVRDLEDGSTHRVVHGEQSGDFESLRFFTASTAWAPDGKTLAFVAQARGQDALYLLDATTGRVQEKHRFGLDELQTPSFSPSGEELVFVGLSGGQSDLFRVRRDGTELRRLTEDRYAERDPQWSPDGKSIVYVTDAGGGTDLEALHFERWRLRLLELGSLHSRDITPFASGQAVSPVWAGDGECIAFVSDQDGIPNIYILSLPTQNVFRLTDTVGGIGGVLPSSPALSWARGSDRLVFSAFDHSGWDIYRIDRPRNVMQPVLLAPEAADAQVAAAGATEGTAVEPGPVVEATPAKPAAAGGALPAALEVKERRYKPRLAPDLSHVGGVVGSQGGIGGASLLHFSDLLGDHLLTIGLGIYGSLKDSDLSVDYVKRSGRTSYRFGAFQYSRRYGFLGSQMASVEKQTYLGVRTAASRPFDKFSRLEASLQLAGVRGRFYLGETPTESVADPSLQEVRLFVGPGLAYVVDTALFGRTGPIMGRRLRLSLESGFGELDFRTVELDLRQYWSFGPSFSVAARGYLASSWGATPQTFYLGGAYTLRGYAYGALTGRHAGLLGAEFRFPLLHTIALGWPLPLQLTNVRGVLFAETGSAWDQEFLRTSRATVGSALNLGPQVAFGFGTRLDLGAYLLRLDWAQRYDPATGRMTPGSSIAIGADF